MFVNTSNKISLGTWNFSGLWGPRNDRAAIDFLAFAFDSIDWLDTAWSYGNGHVEGLIASAFKQNRSAQNKVKIITKIPPKDKTWPAQNPQLKNVFPINHLEEYLNKSLQNLKQEKIDLLLLHGWNADWFDQCDDLFSWVEKQKKAGRIDKFGMSLNDHQSFAAKNLVGSEKIDACELLYNIFDPRAKNNLWDTHSNKKTLFFVRSIFDEGGLTPLLDNPKKINWHKKDWRKHYFTKERLAEYQIYRSNLKKLAQEWGLELTEMALRFCLSQPQVFRAIIGTHNKEHFLQNLEWAQKGPLSDDLLKKLEAYIWLKNFYPQYTHPQ